MALSESAPLGGEALCAALLEQTLQEWAQQGPGQGSDLWVFAYASLIWRPEAPVSETRRARVYGHHRALKMWSTVNRGTPELPGLVFTLLHGGSCDGVVQRVACREVPTYLPRLWAREMPIPVYRPTWVQAHTAQGAVRALAFALDRRSPRHTGELPASEYRRIFQTAQGRCGTTLDYAHQTHEQLLAMGIRDRALARLLRHAEPEQDPTP